LTERYALHCILILLSLMMGMNVSILDI
jgi:hypothetical protein